MKRKTKTRPFKYGDRVEIEWTDTAHVREEPDVKLVRCCSRGFFYQRTKLYTAIAQSYESSAYFDILVVPNVNIKKISRR